MPLVPGSRLGAYEIVAAIGAGMNVIARDATPTPITVVINGQTAPGK